MEKFDILKEVFSQNIVLENNEHYPLTHYCLLISKHESLDNQLIQKRLVQLLMDSGFDPYQLDYHDRTFEECNHDYFILPTKEKIANFIETVSQKGTTSEEITQKLEDILIRIYRCDPRDLNNILNQVIEVQYQEDGKYFSYPLPHYYLIVNATKPRDFKAQKEIANLFIEYGANPDLADSKGVKFGHYQSKSDILFMKFIDILEGGSADLLSQYMAEVVSLDPSYLNTILGQKILISKVHARKLSVLEYCDNLKIDCGFSSLKEFSDKKKIIQEFLEKQNSGLASQASTGPGGSTQFAANSLPEGGAHAMPPSRFNPSPATCDEPPSLSRREIEDRKEKSPSLRRVSHGDGGLIKKRVRDSSGDLTKERGSDNNPSLPKNSSPLASSWSPGQERKTPSPPKSDSDGRSISDSTTKVTVGFGEGSTTTISPPPPEPETAQGDLSAASDEARAGFLATSSESSGGHSDPDFKPDISSNKPNTPPQSTSPNSETTTLGNSDLPSKNTGGR